MTELCEQLGLIYYVAITRFGLLPTYAIFARRHPFTNRLVDPIWEYKKPI
jgi:hypothetical protein